MNKPPVQYEVRLGFSDWLIAVGEVVGDVVCKKLHRALGEWAEDYVMSTPTYGSWPRGTMRCRWCRRLWLPGSQASQVTEEGVR